MQLLLLAISIITLTLIAGNGREKASLETNKVSLKMEKPAIMSIDDDTPDETPSVYFSRFDMFVNKYNEKDNTFFKP